MGLDTAGPARLGIYINNRAAVFLGDGFALSSLLALARSCEAAKLDFVAVGDSVLAKPRYSPIVTLAAVAGATDRIGLTTGILQPHLRNPVLLAQEWATLDVASGGRTVLAVGLGTGPRELVDAELSMAGLSRRSRASAMEESISLIRALWRGEPVDTSGPIYSFGTVDAGFGPYGGREVPIVIACGAFVPKQEGHGPNDVYSPTTAGTFFGPFARVARLGDGWVTGMATPSEWRSTWEVVKEEASAIGRNIDVPSFERRLNCFIHIDGNVARARTAGTAFLEAYHRLPMDDETVDRWLIHGPAERCAERLAAYVDAGVNSFQLVLGSRRQEEQLDRVATLMRPLVTPASATAVAR